MKNIALHIFSYLILSALILGCGGDNDPSGVPIYTIGGTISDLNGTVVLQLNDIDTLTVSENGNFTFPGTFRNNREFEVIVLHHPLGYSCKIENAEGTVNGSDITDITISCLFPPSPLVTLKSEFKQLIYGWTEDNTENFYQLYQNPDGGSGFTLIADNIPEGPYSLTVPVHKLDWPNNLYMLQACNTHTCSTSSNQLSTTALDTDAIGYRKASNLETGDRFGSALALSGDGTTLAIASPYEASNATAPSNNGDGEADNSHVASGAVYIFTNNGSEWVQQSYIKASNSKAGDQFGFSLAISNDGNTLAIGAPNEGIDETSTYGSAYVFTRTNNLWSEQQIITPSTQGNGYRFGTSVSLNGNNANTLVVGAPQESFGGTEAWAGASYVFTRANDVWTEHSVLNASNAQAFDRFGQTVTLNADGTALAISATGEASDGSAEVNNDKARSGATYIFSLSNNVWQQTAYLKSFNPDVGDAFG